MLYNRGAREIYDIGWAHAAVAAVPPLPQQSESAEWPWSAELCLPYFKVRGKRSLLRRFLLV